MVSPGLVPQGSPTLQPGTVLGARTTTSEVVVVGEAVVVGGEGVVVASTSPSADAEVVGGDEPTVIGPSSLPSTAKPMKPRTTPKAITRIRGPARSSIKSPPLDR
jgi:hypothetical protein